jgi:hypothetical protein
MKIDGSGNFSDLYSKALISSVLPYPVFQFIIELLPRTNLIVKPLTVEYDLY